MGGLVEEGDDGAIYRFYEWLRLAHFAAQLDAIPLEAFRALVRRYDEGEAP